MLRTPLLFCCSLFAVGCGGVAEQSPESDGSADDDADDKTPNGSSDGGPVGAEESDGVVRSGEAPAPEFDCEAFEVCGGDPTGVWELVQTCASVGGIGAPRCENYEQSLTSIAAEGEIRFLANGEFVVSDTVTATSDFFMPFDCLGEEGPSVCDAYWGSHLLLNLSYGIESTEGGCTASDSGCECSQVSKNTREVDGSYVASTKLLSLTFDESDPVLGGAAE